MSTLENFETHMDRMEREAQQQRAQLAIEVEKTKQIRSTNRGNWSEAIMVVGACFAVVVFLIGFIYTMWLINRGPSASETLRHQEITMCMDNGGKWEPNKGDVSEDEYVAEHCNLPGDGE